MLESYNTSSPPSAANETNLDHHRNRALPIIEMLGLKEWTDWGYSALTISYAAPSATFRICSAILRADSLYATKYPGTTMPTPSACSMHPIVLRTAENISSTAGLGKMNTAFSGTSSSAHTPISHQASPSLPVSITYIALFYRSVHRCFTLSNSFLHTRHLSCAR